MWTQIVAGILIGLIIGMIGGYFIGNSLTTPSSTFTGTIKIGYAESLTGSLAYEGKEGLDGLTLAVEEVNAAGGVLGNSLSIVTGDTAARDPLTVDSVFKRLIDNNQVDVILTGVASNTNAEVETCNDKHMPYLISGSSAQTNGFIGNNGSSWPYIWSFAPLYTAYHTIPEYIELWQSQGYLNLTTKSVALITSDNPYSKYISDGLKTKFNEKGWQIVVDETVPLETITDWSAILSKIRDKKPDLIVNTDYMYTNEGVFLNQFLENPTNSIMFMQYAPSTPEFLNLTGTKSNGIIYNFPWLQTRDVPAYAQLEDKFVARFGYTPGTYAHWLYYELYAYVNSVKAAGDYKDKLKVANQIGQTVMNTSLGTLQFDQQTHLVLVGENLLPACYYQIWNGQRTLLNTQFKRANFTTPPWFH